VQKNKFDSRLRISQKGKFAEYYLVSSSTDSNGKYISSQNKKLIKEIAQRDYLHKALKLLEEEIRGLESCLKHLYQGNNYSTTKLQALYSKMSKARQDIISPITFSDQAYIREWEAIKWEGLPFEEDSPGFTTLKEEKVRSKSEVLIANALTRHSVPYRYEFPLKFTTPNQRQKIIYPDFTCLNVRSRKEIYWEHFGMMDNPDYSNKTVKKLQSYYDNKIFPGDNLIISMECKETPLNPGNLDKIIRKYLL
ncbi:MAG: hypothetical protein K5681_11085, partial [Treponema sp.]|nr:hypothetical protein [Treponema sp.]